jgi:hypothetical protein
MEEKSFPKKKKKKKREDKSTNIPVSASRHPVKPANFDQRLPRPHKNG